MTAIFADFLVPITILFVDPQVALALRQVPRDQVPDMPDRIIAATALVYRLPLVTRDAKIRDAAIAPTIWYPPVIDHRFVKCVKGSLETDKNSTCVVCQKRMLYNFSV